MLLTVTPRAHSSPTNCSEWVKIKFSSSPDELEDVFVTGAIDIVGDIEDPLMGSISVTIFKLLTVYGTMVPRVTASFNSASPSVVVTDVVKYSLKDTTTLPFLTMKMK